MPPWVAAKNMKEKNMDTLHNINPKIEIVILYLPAPFGCLDRFIKETTKYKVIATANR